MAVALIHAVRELLYDAARDLAPTLIVVVIFQAFFIQHLPDNPAALIGGFAVVLLGLALFVKGLDVAIFPIGETMAYDYARRGSFLWLMLFAFSISFASVAAEPALMAVAYKAEAVSGGSMGALTLRMVAALGVGLAVMVGVWRIVRGHSIAHYLIPGYLIVIISTAFAPPELVGLAFDSGGVVASTVTAPLLAALGVGLAMTISGRNPMLDGFGLIAFGALAPMIIIQIYGILFFVPADQAAIAVALPPEAQHLHPALEILTDFLHMVRNLLPIIAVVLLSSYVILRRPLANPKGLAVGMALVALGLYMFDEGLQVGLFPLGEEMTRGLGVLRLCLSDLLRDNHGVSGACRLVDQVRQGQCRPNERPVAAIPRFGRRGDRYHDRLCAHRRWHQYRLLADTRLPAGVGHGHTGATLHRPDRL